MQIKHDGQTYAPEGKPAPVCAGGEFPVGVIGLDHGHIYGMAGGLAEAGADIVAVWDPDREKIAAFIKKFPQAKQAQSREQIFEDPAIRLIASAAIPGDRCEIGIEAMKHGKDYFADKPPLITKQQLELARKTAGETGKKYGVYYSERLHVESAVYAGNLIEQGAIGRVIQVLILAPHRLNAASRPAWFWDKKRYGGILTDIGSHQIEQILSFTGAKTAKVSCARTANYTHGKYPDFEDFGDASFVCDNGAAGYFRVDWFTPNGLGAWGDCRTFILGTDGYIEIRKFIDPARDKEGDHIILVDHKNERYIRAASTCGFPFFGRFLRDCLDRSETAMSQEHAFTAIELAIEAQQVAVNSD